VENDKLDLARELLAEAEQRKFRLVLPVDHVLAESIDSTATRVTDIAQTPDGWMGLDIGPKTIELFSREIFSARTIVWNGPLGMFEKPAFAQGTLAIARAVAAASSKGATSIVGGGDSVAAVEQSGLASQISHISTGGGASLEFLAGERLPGVEALTNKL
jgi:phosphoglycerate kinase